MLLFSRYTEADAINQIKHINREMRAISAFLHLAGGDVIASNRDAIIKHLQTIVQFGRKYDKVKASFLSMVQTLFMGATVDVWNEEQVRFFQ